MGGSEMVVSPVQSESTYSELSTLNRKRHGFHSTDSAFSSPTNSSDGVENHSHAHRHSHSEVLSTDYACNHRVRMLSEASNTSTGRRALPALRLTISNDPAPTAIRHLSLGDGVKDKKSTSLPGLSHAGKHSKSLSSYTSLILPTHSSSTSSTTFASSSKVPKQNRLLLPNTAVPRLDAKHAHQCSPIIKSNDHLRSYSESTLDSYSADLTPKESAVHITSSPSGFSLDSSRIHSTVDRNTIF